jgi:hypothetical protein
MLLTHRTTPENLEKILNDGFIRPATETGIKEQNPYEFNLKYVFFTAADMNATKLTLQGCQLIFEHSILTNHRWYTNTSHLAGISKNTKSYPPKYRYTNSVLSKLYKQSKDIGDEIKRPTSYWAFQEVFFIGRVSLRNLKYLVMDNLPDKLAKIIKEKYPHVIIL